MVIYESSQVQVIYNKRGSDFLMVTFAPAAINADGKSGFFDALFKRNDVSTLCFVAVKPNWYPISEMIPALEACKPYLDEYPERMVMGYSMGAFGAVKYAKAVNARVTIAISPNYTLDPTMGPEHLHAPMRERIALMQVKPEDESTFRGVRITPDCAHGHMYLIYDTKNELDAWQVDKIAETLPNAIKVPMAYGTHQLHRYFTSPRAVETLVKIARTRNNKAIRAFVRKQMRQNPALRMYGLVPMLPDHHFKWALDMHSRYADKLPANDYIAFSNDLAIRAGQLGYDDWAMETLQKVLARNPESGLAIQTYAELLLRNQGAGGAEAKLREQIAADPSNVGLHERLFDILVGSENITAAREMVEEAVVRLPASPTLLQRAAIAAERVGDYTSAIAHAKEAIAHSPNPKAPYNRVRLAQVMMRNYQFDEAEALLEETLKDKPNFPPTLRTLAFVYEQRGKLRRAVELMRDAAAMEPGNEQVKKYLEQLERDYAARESMMNAFQGMGGAN
jgi:tetratricopeptide (TPR) repeat protein